MNVEAALAEFLARLGAAEGRPVVYSGQELAGWSVDLLGALKGAQLLMPIPPAQSLVCPGCEEACAMPVQVLPYDPEPNPFIICETRSDIHRVDVPAAALEQWQTSPEGLARALAGLLGIPYAGRTSEAGAVQEVGLLRGGKRASHVQLQMEKGVSLRLAGHVVPLAEVLRFEGETFKLDHRTLLGLVEAPVGPAGGAESTEARRARLQRWVAEEKRRGTKAFLRAVAEREGISLTRVKQIIYVPKARKRSSKTS